MTRLEVNRRGFLRMAGAAAVGFPYVVSSSALGGSGSVYRHGQAEQAPDAVFFEFFGHAGIGGLRR